MNEMIQEVTDDTFFGESIVSNVFFKESTSFLSTSQGTDRPCRRAEGSPADSNRTIIPGSKPTAKRTWTSMHVTLYWEAV